jgi:hypothetical protein
VYRLIVVVNMLPFKHPFTAFVSGPTGCGKTQFTFKLIESSSEMIVPSPTKIYYCYGEYQPIFANYPQVLFNEGLPDVNIFDGTEPKLLIIDDLMNETNNVVASIFTKISHHRNVSVIYIAQNLFPKNKHARTMSLNSHYVVVFKNPRDAGQFSVLARQMYPQHANFAIEAYKDATDKPYGYLLVDLKPDTDEQYRIRSNIFPGEHTSVYVRKT